jgi:hypothetical protein
METLRARARRTAASFSRNVFLRARETSRLSLQGRVLLVGMCYRVIRDAKRRIAKHPPRAEDDQCPAYYGVDYIVEKGKAVCKFTVHEGTKTLRAASAPADRRSSRVDIHFSRRPGTCGP